ncbi:hypothetical protein AB6F65_09850 [Providencia hangzhouensis]|uniref:hypothetical protein n=1 Tax=Providencia hangzhouensis TaxID=3031799 RepID=UPI0034DCDEB3
MTVTTEVAKVYYSPTRNRRYFSKEAAIKAEAKARIFKKYPSEPYESDTGYAGYNIWDDRPEFYQRALRFLSYLIKKNIN